MLDLTYQVSLVKCRESRTYRGYAQLIHYIPSMKTKLVDLDVPELNQCFREVSSHFSVPDHD